MFFPLWESDVQFGKQDNPFCNEISKIKLSLSEKRVSARKNKPLYENITIIDIGSEGKSLAKVGDKVVFTTHAVPGDVVDLQVTVKKKRYEEARIVRYRQYSENRTEPFCHHFGLCGGCKWQYLPYSSQLYYKQKQVADQLSRIGKLDLPEICPILGSPNTILYRNKLEFTFSNNRWLLQEEINNPKDITEKNVLGFHVPGMFDKVFQVNQCSLQDEPSNSIRNFLFEYGLTHQLEFFDLKAQTGFLRTVIIRTASTGEVMVIVNFFHENKFLREALLQALQINFPEITSLMYVINPKGNDTITDLDVLTFYGKDHIMEKMEGLHFKIGPKSFYQTNSAQACTLYSKVREFAGLTGNETVYDLYTGTGTIACFLANSCRKVIGIEYVQDAVRDAVINSEINGIGNAEFYAGDIRSILTPLFIEKHGHPDVVITDPPRSGMHEDVVYAILGASPSRIVYVSCNPATQARDLALMSDFYSIEKVQPVDMFPHTHHVENIVVMKKKG
jgi:23S rRNA (uracil1939-C5)-methyltransferase